MERLADCSAKSRSFIWERGNAFPKDPPVNMSAETATPMSVPGCRVLASLMAYIPDE